MPSSAAHWWKGIKQDSPAQMTHDMALRSGPLFMASHVSKGLLPWGASWLLPPKPAFSTHLRPGRHTKKRIQTLSSVGIPITIMWQHAHMAEKYAEIKYIPSWRGLFRCTTFTVVTLFHKKGSDTWSATSEELTSCQATSRPLPGTHCLFYQSLWCGKGCEIWRESEEEMWWEHRNTLAL